MGKSKKVARKLETKHAAPQQQPSESEASAAQQESAAAEPVATTRKPKKESVSKATREERNGVKRPGPGKCLDVWEYLDQHGDMKPNDLKPVAVDNGWNQSNALIELYQWRKFNGVTRAATK
jgi:hypothetical protein